MSASKAFLSGGGPKAVAFPKPGTSVTGTVLSQEVTQQTDVKTQKPAFWDDGNPKMQLVLHLQTDLREDADDDGVRRLFVPWGGLRKALMEALASLGVDEVSDGDRVTATYTHDLPKTNPAFNAPKAYAVQLVPGAGISGPTGTPLAVAEPVAENTIAIPPAPAGMPQDVWEGMGPDARAAILNISAK
jgi:hypothetical protein